MNAKIPIESCAACRKTSAENTIEWNYIPVPYFGKLTNTKIATVGLNPAKNESQLPKLADHRKKSREELTGLDVLDCGKRRENYFLNSDWHNYFSAFDSVLGRVNYLWSYARNVVHIDLVACVTKESFGNISENPRKALVGNCSQNFLKTLAQLSADAILLLDGRTVCDAIFDLGRVNFEIGPELILITPKMEGLRGSIEIGGKQLKFRGWNLPVSKLTPPQRIELAIWLRGHCS